MGRKIKLNLIEATSHSNRDRTDFLIRLYCNLSHINNTQQCFNYQVGLKSKFVMLKNSKNDNRKSLAYCIYK